MPGIRCTLESKWLQSKPVCNGSKCCASSLPRTLLHPPKLCFFHNYNIRLIAHNSGMLSNDTQIYKETCLKETCVPEPGVVVANAVGVVRMKSQLI